MTKTTMTSEKRDWAAYTAFLKECEAEVAKWPAWKRNGFGGKLNPKNHSTEDNLTETKPMKKTDLATLAAMVTKAHGFLVEDVILEDEGLLIKQLSLGNEKAVVRFLFDEQGELFQVIIGAPKDA